jgi:hypothetical protein
MDNRRALKSWIAGMAAYAVVLQLFVAGLVHHAYAGPTLDASAICYGNGAGDKNIPGKAPAHQMPCLLCVCSIAGAPGIVPVAAAAPVRNGLPVALVVSLGSAALVAALPTPRLSQGPPARA